MSLLRRALRDAVVRTLCVVANLICASLFGAALWLMQQPQVFIGVALFAVAAIASLASRPRPS